MIRAALAAPTAGLPQRKRQTRVRPTPSAFCKAQLAIPFDGEPRRPPPASPPAVGGATAVARVASEPRAKRLGAIDWPGAREGAREVFLTLLTTIAIGLGWAAIEAGRIGADLAGAPVSDGGSRYDHALASGR